MGWMDFHEYSLLADAVRDRLNTLLTPSQVELANGGSPMSLAPQRHCLARLGTAAALLAALMLGGPATSLADQPGQPARPGMQGEPREMESPSLAPHAPALTARCTAPGTAPRRAASS
jgi:hypothetical protein